MQGKLLGFISKIKGIYILRDGKQAKAIRKFLIKYFAFYYNSVYTVYKNTKYGIGWWL